MILFIALNTAYLLFGSNLGNRKENIEKAIALLSSAHLNFEKLSSYYVTEPWGKKDQPEFYNLVARINTTFSATDLLRKINIIEKELGRQRIRKWEERIIDIDILFYNDEIIVSEDLKIPHPFLHQRRFTLIPLAEVTDEEFKHPVLNLTVAGLLQYCEDPGVVRQLSE